MNFYDKLKKSISNTNNFDIQKLLEVMQHKEDYQKRFMVVSGQKIKSIIIFNTTPSTKKRFKRPKNSKKTL